MKKKSKKFPFKKYKYHNLEQVIIYTIIAVVFLWYGLKYNSIISLIGAGILGLVDLYWIFKSIRKL